MAGYWRDAAATAEVMTDDGWYRTGDVVAIDKDGLVTFRDRSRDVIVSGGLNIYPAEIERVLDGHPAVSLSAVVAAPDHEWGECVVAFVVPRDKAAVTESDLIDWVAGRLARYKKPREVRLVDSLPMNPNGKILKRQIKDTLWAGQPRRIS
jgi:acyl-CoA synthetase (AMP-forming)/AMP-acid ligase II